MAFAELDWSAIGRFSALWLLVCISFLSVAGCFPLGSRPGARSLLALGNGALMIALAGVTLTFAAHLLHWTTVVIAGGLIFLFAPSLLEFSRPLRSASSWLLVILAASQCAALAAMLRL